MSVSTSVTVLCTVQATQVQPHSTCLQDAGSCGVTATIGLGTLMTSAANGKGVLVKHLHECPLVVCYSRGSGTGTPLFGNSYRTIRRLSKGHALTGFWCCCRKNVRHSTARIPSYTMKPPTSFDSRVLA